MGNLILGPKKTIPNLRESPNLPRPHRVRDSFAIPAIRGANTAPIPQ